MQSSSLLTLRVLAKQHRLGFADVTSTSSSKVNGPLCCKSKNLKIKKSQYKLQMVNPKATTGGKDILGVLASWSY